VAGRGLVRTVFDMDTPGGLELYAFPRSSLPENTWLRTRWSGVRVPPGAPSFQWLSVPLLPYFLTSLPPYLLTTLPPSSCARFVLAVPRSSIQSACEFLIPLHQLLRIFSGCQLLESLVRPTLVVVGSPSIDHGTGVSQIIEPVRVQAYRVN